MELLVTIAYFCLVWLIFYKFRLMRFNLFWKFVVFGLYCAAAMTRFAKQAPACRAGTRWMIMNPNTVWP